MILVLFDWFLTNDARQGTPTRQPFSCQAIRDEPAHIFPFLVVLLREPCETKPVRYMDFHAARKFCFCATKRFTRNVDLVFLGANRHQHLANVHPSSRAIRFTKSTAHASGKPISSST